MSRDEQILKHIIGYCQDVYEANEVFVATENTLNESKTYRHAVMHCIEQIGELTNTLSKEFKEQNAHIPWKAIRDMRNIGAHEYHHINNRLLWGTITNDVPELEAFCKEQIEKMQETALESSEGLNNDLPEVQESSDYEDDYER